MTGNTTVNDNDGNISSFNSGSHQYDDNLLHLLGFLYGELCNDTPVNNDGQQCQLTLDP